MNHMRWVEIFMKVYLLSWCNPSKLSHSPSTHQNIYQYNILHNRICKSQSSLKKILKNLSKYFISKLISNAKPKKLTFFTIHFIFHFFTIYFMLNYVMLITRSCSDARDTLLSSSKRLVFLQFSPFSPYMRPHLYRLSYLKTVSFECIC